MKRKYPRWGEKSKKTIKTPAEKSITPDEK
jgi:hypothetical protein